MKIFKRNKENTFTLYISFIALIIGIVTSCDDVDYAHVPESSLSHSVSQVSPNAGDFGHEITITGENFSLTPSNNKVRFNGVLAVVKSGSATELVVDVPEGAATGDLTVSHKDITVNTGVFTVAPFPVIDSFSPEVGQVGDEVIITGEKFSTVLEENLVSFNGTQATVTESTETSITVTIPDGATSGPITVTVNGHSDTSESDFNIAITFVVALDSNDDDVEEVAVDFGEPVGTMDLSSSDLEFGEISSGQGLMNIGLRFNNVMIPQAASITEANIQFNADNTGSDAVELTIYGENIADAAPYSETAGDLSERTLTSANEVWNIAPWSNIGDRGDAQKTVNIASIIQEIVNRDDWVSGNSINIIMKHSGVSVNATSSSGGREAENYSSSDSSHGAELTVLYQ